jgi:hypothetical protein
MKRSKAPAYASCAGGQPVGPDRPEMCRRSRQQPAMSKRPFSSPRQEDQAPEKVVPFPEETSIAVQLSRNMPTSTARSTRSSSQSMRSSAKVRGAAGAVTHHVKAVSAYQGIVTLSRAHRVGSSPRPCC